MTTYDDRTYRQHILECIFLIKKYTRGGKNEFMQSSLIQDAVIRRLQTMAESSQKLSPELKAQAPDINWRALSGFRNVLTHDYLGGIDLVY
ncbi:DUF86 domain-containing protein [Leptolyngbya cf. ectocarpi LEGE 11479]|uniref:DUF86 domain-containing protein n=1 Tax=Leptolyngbya cf. ectocarpi LEGE 11479 TaxID=1828722 RepID=A0A928ZWP1_LEPEC|nr:HepT-like ribonuclease domain-containing protein [Leptolyngbya ectocarpi]MBE9068808.1 DUF86 domain-containing protein [Leptolyngbya cf. ectocarpi LEGE 11479]